MQKHIYQVNIKQSKADVAILMQDQKKKLKSISNDNDSIKYYY